MSKDPIINENTITVDTVTPDGTETVETKRADYENLVVTDLVTGTVTAWRQCDDDDLADLLLDTGFSDVNPPTWYASYHLNANQQDGVVNAEPRQFDHRLDMEAIIEGFRDMSAEGEIGPGEQTEVTAMYLVTWRE